MTNLDTSSHSVPRTLTAVGTAGRSWAKWAIIIGGWTLVGLFLGIRHYLDSSNKSWHSPFLWLSCAYIWAALTPPTLYLAQRFPLRRRIWARNLAIHIPAGFLFSLLYLAISALAAWLILGMPVGRSFSFQRLRSIFFAELSANTLAYWSIVVVAQALAYYRRGQENELRASQLQVRASQLEVSLMKEQLSALKMQIHPHFLFNTLNTISVLMKEDVQAANRMLLRLSDLLRITLDNATVQEISLRQELALLNSYLDIERTRFHDRLTVRMDIDSNALDACVPMFLLQPLVENAIRHGIAQRPSPGTIQVSAERKNGTVELCVKDDGPGFPEAASATETRGIGLSNTRARLRQLYHESYSFDLINPAEGGLVVTVTIPLRLAGDSAAAAAGGS
jgi:two-component system LytT family sensor kinase